MAESLVPLAEKIIIGLIAEGTTDHVIIEEILKERFAPQDIEIRRLQPTPDQTSGKGGGWAQVLGWCERHPPEQRHREWLSAPIFKGGPPPCDLMLFHLDTDAADKIAVALEIPASDEPIETLTRCLDLKLWPPEEPRISEGRQLKFLAKQCTETWIVAGGFPDWEDPEAHDPIPKLIILNPGLEKRSEPGLLKAKKQKMWRRLFRKHLAGRVSEVADRCSALGNGLSGVGAFFDMN